MITRRNLVLACGAGLLAAPLAAFAQRRQMFRVGILATGTQRGSANLYGAFARALKDLGHVEGKSIAFESRYADGKFDRLPALAAELVNSKVDILFAPTSPAVHAARAAAGHIPIVFAVVNDPVERGFVGTLRRPGGSITGVMSVAPGLSVQRLQLLKEMFPRSSRVAVAIAREPSATKQVFAQLDEVRRAAETNGLEMLPIEIRSRKSFADASEVLHKWRADSLSCLDSAVNFYNRGVLIEFAEQMKLPAVYTSGEYVEAGGLMSYGANTEWNYRHAAMYVDKILRGAKPGELPVEAPTRVELAINRNAADELGVAFSQAILQKANRVVG